MDAKQDAKKLSRQRDVVEERGKKERDKEKQMEKKMGLGWTNHVASTNRAWFISCVRAELTMVYSFYDFHATMCR